MMKTVILPEKAVWASLCRRPLFTGKDIDAVVKSVLNDVRTLGDSALLKYMEKFDGVKNTSLKVTEQEISDAAGRVSSALRDAILAAKQNIEKFHSTQLLQEKAVETAPGVLCWRRSVAIEKAGLYVPGGNAPLFSTILMLGIPAKIAGCSEIVLCTPPSPDGKVNPVILYTAQLAGINSVFRSGGAQAIAAMAYGTETIPRVDKIFGPGNQYVTRAKELVQLDGVAIDMPAGPSEVLVIADNTGNPEFIAADLLSQAEHGPDSQVVFLTDNDSVLYSVRSEVEKQLKSLPTRENAGKSLGNSMLILLPSIDDCLDFSNLYAPEHLILAVADADKAAGMVRNAGSVFLGNFSCESAGDYASGTNHTLPTNGYARAYSGLSVDSFVKKITFQKLTGKGIAAIGPVIETMAEAETLIAHKNAVSVRLKSLKDE
jgi:histidinol dehydrogenase